MRYRTEKMDMIISLSPFDPVNKDLRASFPVIILTVKRKT
jgi:hypothetical protein